MRGKRWVPLLIVLLVGVAGAWAVRQPRRSIDVSKRGPQIGERVPDFSLPDQHGKMRTLDSIMGPRGAMLLFHRSADW